MVRKSPRKEENVIFFHISWEKCMGIAATFTVLLTIFILQSDAMGKLSFNASAFCEIVDKTYATVEVQETEVKTAEIVQYTIEETTSATENESIPTNDIIEQQKFMAIASQSVDNTLNLMSVSDTIHIYTSSRSIEEIIAEIGPQMNISKTSGISREDFIYALENCDSDKHGNIGANAGFIWDQCQERNLNEFAIAGLIAIESGWASPVKSPIIVGEKKNIMSVKNDDGIYKTYDEYSESIRDGIRLIAEEYIDENGEHATGGNLTDVGGKYDPGNPLWPIKVAECAEMTTRALVKDKED